MCHIGGSEVVSQVKTYLGMSVAESAWMKTTSEGRFGTMQNTEHVLSSVHIQGRIKVMWMKQL